MNPILAWFYPPRCPYCDKLISCRETECADCRRAIPDQPYIQILPSGDCCLAPFRYEGTVQTALIQMKFHGIRYYCVSFAKAIALQLKQTDLLTAYDVVTCIPLFRNAQRNRGFNQAEEIAVNLARILPLPFEHLLVKIRNNQPQHELNAAQRAENIKNVYRIAKQDIAGKKILLVDDICTTGHTLSEGCRVLRQAGAEKILCVTVAVSGGDPIDFL